MKFLTYQDIPKPQSLISTNITDMTEPTSFLEKWNLALPAFWRVEIRTSIRTPIIDFSIVKCKDLVDSNAKQIKNVNKK